MEARKPAPPVVTPRRRVGEAAGELLFLAAPGDGSRSLHRSTSWYENLEDPPGRWRTAPDPLR